MSIKYNEQQQQIIEDGIDDRFQVLSVRALAGTGKSTTMKGLDEELTKVRPDVPVAYFVFNKKNATEARRKMQRTTAVLTAHSAALKIKHPDAPEKNMAQIYSETGRLVSSNFYGALRQAIDGNPVLTSGIYEVQASLKLTESQALMAIQGTLSNFCRSFEARVSDKNVPKELVNKLLRAAGEKMTKKIDFTPLLTATQVLFDRMRDPTSNLPISHDFYLKLAGMHPTDLGFRYIIFDEAQDTNPPMVQILMKQIQSGAQLVVVGDQYQSIYKFTGAMDAMTLFTKRFPNQSFERPLTISYRFGQEIADAGNIFLEAMGSKLKLVGMGHPDALVTDGKVEGATAILHRTNAGLITTAAQRLSEKKKVYIPGGIGSTVKLLEGLSRLYKGEFAAHPDLTFFTNWAEFEEFAKYSEDGREYKPLYKMIDENKGDVTGIISSLEGTSARPSKNAEIHTTAHKSKGMEYAHVNLGDDMQDMFERSDSSKNANDKLSFEDHAISYVAVTRAEKSLHCNGMMDMYTRYLAGFHNLQKNSGVENYTTERLAKTLSLIKAYSFGDVESFVPEPEVPENEVYMPDPNNILVSTPRPKRLGF